MSHYEINVALNGKHYFATHERSIVDPWKAKEVLQDFQKRFPASEGFKVECTHYQSIGNRVTLEDLQ